LAHAFRGLITDLIGQYRREDSRQLVMFPEFVEESLPAQYEVEHLDLSRYQNILEQLSPLKALTDLDVFDRDRRFISELRFYVIAVQTPTGEPVYFFHTYTRKMTLGRSFICSVFKDDCYDRITDPVLIFDSEIDCMCRGNTMYIFKKSGFQKIFQVFDEIRQVANEALESIKVNVPIKNFDDFSNDCGKHIWKQHKLKKIASKSYLGKLTMAHLKRVIEHNKLNVEIVVEDGKEMLVYDPKDKWVILKLLDDNYLWSMLTEKNYEVTGKRELS
jgi:hypothetical protein